MSTYRFSVHGVSSEDHALICSDYANATRTFLRDVLGWKHVASTNQLKLLATAQRLGVRWLATAFARRTGEENNPAVVCFPTSGKRQLRFASPHALQDAGAFSYTSCEVREVLECWDH